MDDKPPLKEVWSSDFGDPNHISGTAEVDKRVSCQILYTGSYTKSYPMHDIV